MSTDCQRETMLFVELCLVGVYMMVPGTFRVTVLVNSISRNVFVADV